jgi:thioredoxin 1
MIEITDREFNKEVLECEMPVFACFTTGWCHNCFSTCLLADQLVSEYGRQVKFTRIDIERNPEIAERYHIVAVPTILLFKGSNPVNRLVGYQNQRSLKKILNSMDMELRPS